MEDYNLPDYNFIDKGGYPVGDEPFRTRSAPQGFFKKALPVAAGKAASSVLGLPASAIRFVQNPLSKATGGAIPTYEQYQEKYPFSLPLPEQWDKFLSSMSGGITEPEDESQDRFGNFIGDIATDLATTALLPYKGPGVLYNIGKKLAGATARAGAANTVALAANKLGASPETESWLKFGTYVAPAVFGLRPAMFKAATDRLENANVASNNKFWEVDRLRKAVRSTEEMIDKLDFPSKKFVKERFESIKNLSKAESPILKPAFGVRPTPKSAKLAMPIQKGEISVGDALKLKRSLNEYFNDPSIPFKTEQHLTHAMKPLNNFLDDYAKRGGNKDFSSNYRSGNDLYKSLHDFSDATKFLNDKIDLAKNIKNPLAHLMAYGAIHAGYLPQAIGGIGAALGIRESSKLIDLLKSSAYARNTWFKMMESATKRSIGSTQRYLKEFDKAVTKSGILPSGFEYED